MQAKLLDQEIDRKNMNYLDKLQTMRERNRQDYFRKQYFEEKRRQNIFTNFERVNGISCPDQTNDRKFKPMEYDNRVFKAQKLIRNPRRIQEIQ